MKLMKALLGVLKWAGAALALAVLTVAVLYAFFDLRLVVDSDGFHLRFVKSADDLAAEIAAHREAQRQTTPDVTQTAAGRTEVQSALQQAPLPAATTPPSELASPAVDRPAASGYWTGFRGPRRDGRYTEMTLRTEWPAGALKPLWKQPAGGGYASFAVARGRAFTIEQRGPDEVIAAYDADTGREIWTNRYPALFSEIMGGDGPRATPAWVDGLVYSLGAEGELRCLDEATGRLIWRANILEDHGASNLQWGMAASPLALDDVVVVLPGGPNGHSVAAYDRRTGKVAWTALDDRQAYVAPMLATIAGVRQIVVVSADRVLGLATDGSRVLWQYPWVTFQGINAAQPIVISDTRVFVSSGYGVGAAVIEIEPEGDAFRVREVWRNIRMKNQFSASVLHEGFIYGLDEAILACVDAATGDLKWKGGRYGYGQLVIAGDRLIVLTEDGDLALVRATPERHDELARVPALEGKTWNHPAIEGGRLLVRNLQEMAAFDLSDRDRTP